MTETQWLTSTDPSHMLAALPASFSERKLRLVTCACVRDMPISQDRSVQKALLVAERFTGGLATSKELEAVSISAWPHKWEGVRSTFISVFLGGAESLLGRVGRFLAAAGDRLVRDGYRIDKATGRPYRVRWDARFATEKQAQAALLRHVLGNPFAPPATASFFTPEISGLAEALVSGEECAFALHDALLEGGQDELAAHFCNPADRHPKGCFALDMILGQS